MDRAENGTGNGSSVRDGQGVMGQDGTFEWEIDKSSHDLGFEVTRHKSNLVTIHMDARKGIEIQKGDEDFEKSVQGYGEIHRFGREPHV